VALIPASAPDFFLENTPTAVLVRQVLGAIAQFEKGTMVAKLRAARERKRAGARRRVQRSPAAFPGEKAAGRPERHSDGSGNGSLRSSNV
jgi:DNA invertase Pin-like site-specific DNA recombinase